MYIYFKVCRRRFFCCATMEYGLLGFSLILILALVYEHRQHRSEVSQLLDRLMAKDVNEYMALSANEEDEDDEALDEEVVLGLDSTEIQEAILREVNGE